MDLPSTDPNEADFYGLTSIYSADPSLNYAANTTLTKAIFDKIFYPGLPMADDNDQVACVFFDISEFQGTYEIGLFCNTNTRRDLVLTGATIETVDKTQIF